MTNENRKNQTGKPGRRILKGRIVSDKMRQTAVVLVERFVRHPKYGKYLRRSKKYKADNPQNRYQSGERVTIEECRPISKDKHFRIIGKEEKI